MVVLALILIITFAVVYILYPLGKAEDASPPTHADEEGELHARREQLLFALQDLDFELQTGKLSPEDHRAMRERVRLEAVEVLRRLDEMRSRPRGPARRDGGA